MFFLSDSNCNNKNFLQVSRIQIVAYSWVARYLRGAPFFIHTLGLFLISVLKCSGRELSLCPSSISLGCCFLTRHKTMAGGLLNQLRPVEATTGARELQESIWNQ
jgi:hypothetical protein